MRHNIKISRLLSLHPYTLTIYSHTPLAYVPPLMEQFLTWESRTPPVFCEILILYQNFEVFILSIKNKDLCFKILPWIRNISATVQNFCTLITGRTKPQDFSGRTSKCWALNIKPTWVTYKKK